MTVAPRDDRRILWFDSLRGVTVLLVVLHHSFWAALPWLHRFGDTQIHWTMWFTSETLGMVRMPAFFLCSGILFAVTMQRGWAWFTQKRLAFAGWIILLWTLIFYGAAELVLDLYPSWNPPADGAPWAHFLWAPYFFLWFVYAIAILGAVALLLQPLPVLWQVVVATGLALVIYAINAAVDFPLGMEWLLNNLALRGLPFFLLGVLLSARFRASPAPGARLTLIAVIALMSGFLAVKLGWGENPLTKIALSVPMTFGAVTLLRWLLERWDGLARATAKIGKQSLEIFILHPIGISAGFYGLTLLPSAPHWSVVLATIFLSAVLVALFLAALLRRAPGNIFFRAPSLPRLRAARQVPAE